MNVSSNSEWRLPKDFRKSLLSFEKKREVLKVMRAGGLATVCEEARCPNIGECFSNNTATFMIMGDRCTRRCHFCSVTTKKPLPLDELEPQKVAEAAKNMGLDYVVVTSVDRDEQKDLGANHFYKVITEIKRILPTSTVEILTPDFKGREELIDLVLKSPVDVFGHNIETVSRLYRSLRPQSDFSTSKKVLRKLGQSAGITVKSGMMVGVGESDEEVFETLDMLRDLNVDIVTIGQYLRPSRKHWPVDRYVEQKSFQAFVDHGLSLGFKNVFAGPFVRSSYHAKETHLDAQKSIARPHTDGAVAAART